MLNWAIGASAAATFAVMYKATLLAMMAELARAIALHIG